VASTKDWFETVAVHDLTREDFIVPAGFPRDWN
jgi:hypothetical protein